MSRHPVQCSFQTKKVTLQQTEKFKYLGVTFLSDGRQDNELDTRIGKASAIMRQLCQSVVLKRELCTRAKLSVFKLVFVPILSYGHECWAMNKRVRFQIPATEMGFLKKVRGLSLLVICQLRTSHRHSPISSHRTANTSYGTIATSLVWSCDMNVSQKNSKATNGCFSQWPNAKGCDPDLAGEIRLMI